MPTIDISCDLGEAESQEDRLREERIWPLITSANVACGGHAGDRNSMELAVRHCAALGVTLGAHPSYPDRLHFGRSRVDITEEALRQSLIEQISELRDIAEESGVRLGHVKPHGALYNEAHHDASLAQLIVAAVTAVDPSLIIVASPGSELLRAAGERGVPEGFGDRRYLADGSLAPRGTENALLLDYDIAAAQAVALAKSGRFATLCVHGDMENAPERLTRIRERLQSEGFVLSSAGRS